MTGPTNHDAVGAAAQLHSSAGKRNALLRDAANNLKAFADLMDIPGVPALGADPLKPRYGAHHLLWLKCLQEVEDGKIKRLMGLMPPGSAKSTYTSVVFPVHVMGRFPGHQVIVASYGTQLPRKWGRRARGLVKQPTYKQIFNTLLSKESSAADEWALSNGSDYMGVGILSGITGNRADGVVWDDLIKGRKNADSEVIRQSTWDAYLDDVLTRKKPDAWEIGITTRWHEDDIAGRILPLNYAGESGLIECRDGNEWYVVCIPAEAERADDVLGRKVGERIWPEHFSDKFLASFKRQPRTWSALFQQRPAPDTGVYFERDWLRTAETVPPREQLRVYGASDYAVTSGGGDYTVHVVVGLDADGRMYLLDLWRRQAASNIWVESFCDLVLKWKPIGWAEEHGQIRAGIGPFMDEQIRQRAAFTSRKQFATRGDKETRAQSIRGRMAQEGLYIPAGAPWYADLRSELMSFPAGRHDDQVDALALIGQLLDIMVRPGKEKKTLKPWYDRWETEEQPRRNWKLL